MNASRRAARKFNVRAATETRIRKELKAAPSKSVAKRLAVLMDKVHMFLTYEGHRAISQQAFKLGLLVRSPLSLRHRRSGIATR